MSIKDFPKKCLACKKEGIPLNDFEYIRRRAKRNRFTNTVTTTSTSVTFPTCDTCEKKIESAMKAGNRARKYKRLIIPLIIFLIVFVVLNNFTSIIYGLLSMISVPINSFLLQIIVIGLVSVVIVVMIIQIIMASKNPHKIENFIIFNKDNTYSIVDPEYAKEVKENVQERIEEEVKEEIFGIDEENAIYCPKCGAQSKKGTDFCKKCGKDLRVVQ